MTNGSLEAAAEGQGVRGVHGGRRRPGPLGRTRLRDRHSSGGDKTYDVEWSEDGRTVAANDNASYWQGYLGYPVIAVLLARGELRAADDAVAALAGVPWHELNKRHRRDYDAAVAHVLGSLPKDSAALVERQVDDVVAQLAALDLQRAGRGRRPPAGKA